MPSFKTITNFQKFPHNFAFCIKKDRLNVTALDLEQLSRFRKAGFTVTTSFNWLPDVPIAKSKRADKKPAVVGEAEKYFFMIVLPLLSFPIKYARKSL